jgi:hypothetical protein
MTEALKNMLSQLSQTEAESIVSATSGASGERLARNRTRIAQGELGKLNEET